jgi:hypothetical protein
MKKFIGLMLVAVLVVGLAALVGCGGTKTTTKTGEVEVETDKGTTKVSGEVTEKDIGVPVYPGAKMDEDAAGTIKSENKEGESVFSAAVLWTDDPVSEVIAWYRDELKDKPNFMDLTAGIPTTGTEEETAVLSYQEGDTYKMVTIGKGTVDHPGKTEITVSSGSGPGIPTMPTQ